eukprot:SAG31_NODE_45668_length_258_cov_0.622642_1_plen_35_part_10
MSQIWPVRTYYYSIIQALLCVVDAAFSNSRAYETL